MMEHQTDEGIPDFLKVVNRDKPMKGVKRIKTKAAPVAAPEPPADPFENIEPKVADIIREEIRAHRFKLHWLDDPGTVLAFRRTMMEKQIRRDERLAKLAALPKPEKIEKSVFGVGIKIIVLKMRENPKAARTVTFAKMAEFIKKNPSADAAEVFSRTEYTRQALKLDIEKGFVKTDIIGKGR